jgi:chromosome segregation ATPase
MAEKSPSQAYSTMALRRDIRFEVLVCSTAAALAAVAPSRQRQVTDELRRGTEVMNPGEVSLEYITRRFDDLQREATHNRQVADIILKQMKSLYAEFDAQRSRLDLVESRINIMEAKIGERFDAVDQRLDGIDQRLDGIDQQLDGIDKHFEGIGQRLDGIDQRFLGIGQRFNGMNERLDYQQQILERIESKFDRFLK